MKILYFTSTGNSLYVAKKIGGELLSIPQLQKNGVYDINDDVVGIISPVYGLDIAPPVRFYLDKVNITSNYFFAIMTYGSMAMAATDQIKKIFERRNCPIDYINELKMVDNFLPMFEMGKQINVDKKIEPKIEEIINDIKNRKQFYVKHNWFKKYLSNMMSAQGLSEKRRIKLQNSAKDYIVNNDCNGCGICRNVCPMGNIIGNGRPEYLDKCEYCLGCVHLCSKNAIHLKSQKSEKRFINPNVTIEEIIKANKQV
jgi:ferredoxin